jgi:hypothetical protein
MHPTIRQSKNSFEKRVEQERETGKEMKEMSVN